MVRRERLINKLRELGYTFKRDAWRVQIWKRGTHRPAIPKQDLLDEETVASILRQCLKACRPAGTSDDHHSQEIREFIRTCMN